LSVACVVYGKAFQRTLAYPRPTRWFVKFGNPYRGRTGFSNQCQKHVNDHSPGTPPIGASS